MGGRLREPPEPSSVVVGDDHPQPEEVVRRQHPPFDVSRIASRSRVTRPRSSRSSWSRLVMDGVIGSLALLPAHARRSIKFDRGLEFLAWPYLQAGLGRPLVLRSSSPLAEGHRPEHQWPGPPLAAARR